MSPEELSQLDELVEIAGEEDCPLSGWEVGFVQSLDERRNFKMSEKQADVFDRLVTKHLKGE